MLLGLLLGSIALQVWAWRSLQRRVMSGAVTRPAALLRYGGWALLPLLLFVGLFLSAIGAEELTGTATIPEPLARIALLIAALLLGLAGLGWLSFSILCALVWRVPGAKA
jgi:hypothetical protein